MQPAAPDRIDTFAITVAQRQAVRSSLERKQSVHADPFKQLASAVVVNALTHARGRVSDVSPAKRNEARHWLGSGACQGMVELAGLDWEVIAPPLQAEFG